MEEAIRREMAEDPEMRGFTKDEILHNKVQEMRQMSDTKKCTMPGCDSDRATKTGKLCARHLAEARHANAKKGAATKKAGKPEPLPDKPPVTRVLAPGPPYNLCDTCGNADYTSHEDEDVCAETNATLHGIVTSCEWYTTEAKADPRPAPEGHGPAIEFGTVELKSEPLFDEHDRFLIVSKIRGYQLDQEAHAFLEGFLAGRRAA